MAARAATSPLVAEWRLACHRDDKTRHALSSPHVHARWGSQLIAPRPRSPRLCLRKERQLLALRLFLAPAPVPALAPALTLDLHQARGATPHFLRNGAGARRCTIERRVSMQVGVSVPGLVISVACKPLLHNKRTRRRRLRHHRLSVGGGPRTRDSKPDEEPGESELTPAWAPVARPSTHALRPPRKWGVSVSLADGALGNAVDERGRQ
jgi:hypothetical protein